MLGSDPDVGTREAIMIKAVKSNKRTLGRHKAADNVINMRNYEKRITS
jgi:hypothetical protein